MPSPGLAPRAAAWRILHDLRHGIPFDRSLHRALSGLSDPDGALAHELATGVLRHRTTIDEALNPQLTGGTEKVRDDLLDILRLGAYQVLFLDRVPRHAAVDTAVTLGRRIGGARVGGFINAVLRKVAEAGRTGGRADGRPGRDDRGTAESLAVRYSHPEWLVQRWVTRFGSEETESLLRANNRRASLVIQPARWSEDAIIASLEVAAIPWRPAPFRAGLVVEGARPRELPGFAAGAWQVQDPAQALVARYAAAGSGVVFDACAAPGGKSLSLSRTARLVVANDLRPARIRRLRTNLERASSGPVAALVADAGFPPVRPCDVVLLDTPCLGTGAFARHPDARWRVTPSALSELAVQAAGFLRSLAEVVRPGGLLVFATCSLEPEENELQVEAFLAADARFRREPPADAVPGELLTALGDLLLLPHRHGTDGAYAARLRRVTG